MDGATASDTERAAGRRTPLNAVLRETRPSFVFLLVAISATWFWSGDAPDAPEPDGLGKRIVAIGESAPKGGGHFKIGKPYTIGGIQYIPKEDPSYSRSGTASWYGDLFHGRLTSNGEVFDMERLSAAHPTLPLPVYAEVTNLQNGRSAVVRVNDRGPFRKGRVIDLSKRTAEVLGFKKAGTAKVEVRYLRKAPLDGDDSFEREYLSSRGYSQYAESSSGEPEVVIPVGPPGKPDSRRAPAKSGDAAIAMSLPKPNPSASRRERAQRNRQIAIAADAPLGAMETTGSIAPAAVAASRPLIQAGYFKNQANAERARTTLADVGQVEVAEIVDHGVIYYRVRVGPFADGITAAAALSDIADAGYRGAKIILQN